MKDNATFLADLKRSEIARRYVAQRLAGQAFEVHLPPVEVRPDAAQRMDYYDDGDIHIKSPEWEAWRRVEVKQRNLRFTCEKDYPFQTLLIDEVYKVERKHELALHAYYIVNADCSHFCIIPAHSKKWWKQETHWVAVQKRECTNCVIDKFLVARWL
jgi:hypothetical protein